MGAIRAVAETRQSLTDIREETDRELVEFQRRIAERVANAEREDGRAFNAALSAGWTADELRKIGFPEPDMKVRTRRRAAALPTWLQHYNLERPHLGIGGQRPIDRVNNATGQYS